MITTISRWRGIFAGSIVLVAIGLVTGQAAFFIAATFPLVFSIYNTLTTPPSTDTIVISRKLSSTTPYPGASTTVTVTVTNTGTTPITDLRIIDGVPEELIVTDGSPRAALAVRPNSDVTYQYTIRPSRGVYEFMPATVRIRSLSAGAYQTTQTPVQGDTRVNCTLSVSDAPLQTDTTPYTGTLTTNSPGEGLEFHSTRQYRQGDSIRRVNWREYAKTGSLTTIEYDEPHTAELLIVVDNRETTTVAPYAGAPTGTELSEYAAEQLLTTLQGDNHEVGLAILDSDTASERRTGLLSPTKNNTELRRAAAILDETEHDTDLSESCFKYLRSADTITEDITQLCRHLSKNTQIIYISPLVDSDACSVATTFQTYGHELTVISPNISTDHTHGQAIAGVQRGLRLAELRDTGINVLDWSYDTPLELVLANTHITHHTRRNTQ